jgi:hypothetical protein
MKNLFIVTSALNSVRGCISSEDRFQQTIEGLQNLKDKIKDDIIIFTDGSPKEISENYIEEIKKYVNVIFLFNNDADIRKFSKIGKNNESESIMLIKLLNILRQDDKFKSLFCDIKRVFKYSARSTLLPEFDISAYDDLEGKYVFKKAIPSWMDSDLKRDIVDHLYITRFYSFCISLYDNYLNILPQILDLILEYGIDFEHAHYKCLNKSKVVEFDKLYCEGIMATTAEREIY